MEYIEINEALTGFVFAFGPDDGRLLSDDSFQKVLNNISQADYEDAIVSAMPNCDDKDKDVISTATKVWFDSDKQLENIPFAFNQNKKLKLRLAVAKAMGYVRGDKPTSHIEVGDGTISLGEGITTADQERATVQCWNRMAKLDNLEGDFDINKPEDIKSACQSVGIDLPDSWVKSCTNQCIGLESFLHQHGAKDAAKYRATRYGEADNVGKFGEIYGDFVEAYANAAEQSKWDKEFKGRISKDNYDPSDIIIYKGDVASATACLKQCKALLPDWVAARNKYLEFFMKSKDIMGVSLKKVSGKANVEYFNIGEDGGVCKTNSIVDIRYSHERGSKYKSDDPTDSTGCIVIVKGNYKFDGVTSLKDSDKFEGIDESEIALNIRSFGSMGMDVKQVHAGKLGIALGKVPVRFWTQRTGITSNNPHECAIQFAEWVKKAELSDINYLIQEGVKAGPWCLPFVLIH